MLESLGQAVRAGAFAVPGALGVQEGGYVMLGRVVGLGPETALALSLAKRVRELVLGIPGLIAWQLDARGDRAASAARGAAGMSARSRARCAAGGPRHPARRGLPLVRLDAELFVEEARQRTGLDDFGDPRFREPLRAADRRFRRTRRSSASSAASRRDRT